MEIGTAGMSRGETAVGTAPEKVDVQPSVPLEGGEKAGLAAVVEIRFEVNVHASLRTSWAASVALHLLTKKEDLLSLEYFRAFSASAVTSSADRPVTVTEPPVLVMFGLGPV